MKITTPNLPSSSAFLVSLILFPLITSCMKEGECSVKDIRIYQWKSGYTGVHVPKFTVQIVNEAWERSTGVFDVKISCGGFASTNFINPDVFRRLGSGDGGSSSCLVKNGNTISPGEVISFDYSNVLPFNFCVQQLKC